MEIQTFAQSYSYASSLSSTLTESTSGTKEEETRRLDMQEQEQIKQTPTAESEPRYVDVVV